MVQGSSEGAESRNGQPSGSVSARAETVAIAGDLDAALKLVNQAVADSRDPDHVSSVWVAAAVLAHRGLLDRSAMLHWSLAEQSGNAEAAFSRLLAVPGLIGTGSLHKGQQALVAGERQPPGALSLLADAVTLTAQGISQTVAGSPTAALSALVQASSLLESSGPVLLPDTPATLAAIVAHHSGDFDIADSVLERATTAAVGEPLMAPRHRLLQGWTALRRGQLPLARTLLEAATPFQGRLEPRDELYAAAIELGIARRHTDLDGLGVAWRRGREALMRHPANLFVLQPLGELAVGAARLRDFGWARPFLDDAESLLERLGQPPLWAASLRWYLLQVAIVTDDHAAALPQAAVLSEIATANSFAQTLATAAQSWTRVLAADIDAASISAAARGLQDAGLAWDAARLAGQGAIRANDSATRRALLNYARSVQAPAAVAAESSQDTILSEREREVASFVLAGLTYKDIGAKLFISAKTVEHHIARIRQRLSATTRTELLAKLRVILPGPGTSSDHLYRS